ncbi:MAG: zf-HC2 domain-containing protein [Clostridiales Family XIII bacterium]|jgi:hypothetical protein|nr:zf-HC2 domain-containing protein [Clostridiales Family XIII bacterium]
MKYACELVRDLLPLYHDGVCSGESKRLVEEHLSECAECKRELRKMDDNAMDRHLREERDDIVGRHARAEKKKSVVAGIAAACILTVPILVCLIVNLATGHGLDWFFIVLAAIMVVASLTVVPLIAEERKGIRTLGCFAASLTLLLLVCCLYTGGDWFFVAVIPILFGLSVLFAPFAVDYLPLRGFAAQNKGLLVMGLDTVLLYAVVLTGGQYAGFDVSHWQQALLITAVCLLLPWGLFLTIRYAKINGLARAGICALFGCTFVSLIQDVITGLTGGILRLTMAQANFDAWNDTAALQGNVYMLIFLTGCVVGGGLIVAGALRGKKADRR